MRTSVHSSTIYNSQDNRSNKSINRGMDKEDVAHIYTMKYYAAIKVKVAQSCLTLCDPVDYTVHGILQVRILEWIAFPFSRVSF